MSDLADKAGAVSDIEGRGGSFASTRPAASNSQKELRACSCGGRPGYAYHAPLSKNGEQVEVLRCAGCGNRVGPAASRQALAAEWTTGGWVAPTK